jgi:hypothetical protein
MIRLIHCIRGHVKWHPRLGASKSAGSPHEIAEAAHLCRCSSSKLAL